MQEITIGYILISFITGLVIGFIAWIIDDPKIIGLIQIGGIISAYIFLSALFPPASPNATLDTTQFTNSMTEMVNFLVYFVIGDAAGSAGSLYFKKNSR